MKIARLSTRLVAIALIAGCAMPTAQAASPLASPIATPGTRPARINLAHLNFLNEDVEIAGVPMMLTHIYSEFPRYVWVDASGEGIAAVDDVARAAIVYLDDYAMTKDATSLERARRGLNFVLYMQAKDGAFYNFVTDRAGTINRNGVTSYKSLDWWSMRGLWALARGYAIFKPIDAIFAQKLRVAYQTTERALQASITNAGRTITVHGMEVPAWLPGGAADRAGVAVMALAEFQQAEPNTQTAKLLTTLADGIAAFQLGGAGEYPFAMHPDSVNAPGYWHAWGSHQAQALAFAGRVLNKKAWIDSAAREAETFFGLQLAGGLIKEIGVTPTREGQIAYGVNVLVQAYMNLYRATGDVRYARMGGLAASWFFGNNFASTPMVDPQTGRGFDGIDAALKVNQNAGAESTIEALMALQAVMPVPEAARYLDYKAKSHATGWQVIEAETGTEVAGKPLYGRRGWTGDANMSGGRYYELRAGDAISLVVNAPAAGDYWLYASHMRRAPAQIALTLQAVPAISITVDGKLDEWSAAPPTASDQASQVLRGAQFWRGVEADRLIARAMWDKDKLYVVLEVRDSTPAEESTSPSGADEVWVYLDGLGSGARLSAKFTLGHSAQGARAWDWRAGFWLPKAEVAWQQTTDGYIYEVAVPWASLGVNAVQANQKMGIEIGRSVGGNSFMDLTGRDPDSAGNLAPLMLAANAQPITPTQAAGTPQNAQTNPNAVAFSVAINSAPVITVAQATAPDRDYLWLDRVGAAPIKLNAGANTLRVGSAGSDAGRAALVDAFVLLPMTVTREFAGANGATLTLRYDVQAGRLTWQE